MKLLKSIKTAAFIILSASLSACASSGTAVLNSLAKTDDYTKNSDISYGSNPQNKLDIYSPIVSKNNKLKNPVFVFFYGGCWGKCNAFEKSDYLFIAQSLATKGFTTVIANFRQHPDVNFNGLMSDASSVTRWVSKNISNYGGDPNRMIIIGHSSGAHIAAMLAVNPRYTDVNTRNNIRGFVGLAGPYDFLPLTENYQRALFDPDNNYARSQPINFLSSVSPPLLILHGEKDATVGRHNAVNFSNKAQQLGIKQQMILYPSHNHVSILAALSRPLKGRSSVLNDIVKFANEYTQ